ncbi:helicase associated domain-containing protein [Streptomyces rhizosphaericus]|uniref:helicase associated domain-containing protein n=1 Tax=Streptomyces rhizosphaericus TaxID=114699 RepID=UPI00362AF184
MLRRPPRPRAGARPPHCDRQRPPPRRRRQHPLDRHRGLRRSQGIDRGHRPGRRPRPAAKARPGQEGHLDRPRVRRARRGRRRSPGIQPVQAALARPAGPSRPRRPHRRPARRPPAALQSGTRRRRRGRCPPRRRLRPALPPDTIAQAFKLRVLHPREASFRRGLEAATAYYDYYGHLDVPQLHDDENGFALGRWINRMRKAYAAGTLKISQIRALENIGMIWNLHAQAAERGLLHARNWASTHGHLAVATSEMIGDFAFGRWLTNRRRAARERADKGLEPDPTDIALAELDPYWNPLWSITWQRLYYTARTYAEASITLDDLPADFLTDDDEPLGEWVRTQSTEFAELHPEQIQLVRELGITLIEPPANESPPPTGRAARQLRQLEKGLAAVEAFRAREGHLRIRQRDTVVLDGAEFKVGQWVNNLRKRWDSLPDQHLQAVTAAGLTRHADQDAPAPTPGAGDPGS